MNNPSSSDSVSIHKHREAGKLVAGEFESALPSIHLEILRRGKVTTWVARRSKHSRHGSHY